MWIQESIRMRSHRIKQCEGMRLMAKSASLPQRPLLQESALRLIPPRGEDDRLVILRSASVIEVSSEIKLDSESSFIETTRAEIHRDRKSTRLNSSHANISYAVFCLKKKKK